MGGSTFIQVWIVLPEYFEFALVGFWFNWYLHCNHNYNSVIQNLKLVNLRSSSLYGGFQYHTSMNRTTRILWTILSAGGSISKIMDCTTRTLWICFGRILYNLLLTLNPNKTHCSIALLYVYSPLTALA